MPPEKAEEILADAVADKMVRVQVEHAELAQKYANLTERANILLRRIENRQIEIADAEDHDMPMAKAEESSIRTEIAEMLKTLSEEREKNGSEIGETEKKLQKIEKRIESLEALYPGNEQRS